MNISEVAEKIREARKDKKLTQKEAAKRMGVTREFYARYESGRVNITIEVLDKIAKALDCDLKIDLEPKP